MPTLPRYPYSGDADAAKEALRSKKMLGLDNFVVEGLEATPTGLSISFTPGIAYIEGTQVGDGSLAPDNATLSDAETNRVYLKRNGTIEVRDSGTPGAPNFSSLIYEFVTSGGSVTGTTDYRTLTTVLTNGLKLSGGIFEGDGSGLTNVDAETFDGLDSTQLLRSDADDTYGNHVLTMQGVVRSTNNANVDGANFDVATTNKSVLEYAYSVTRNGTPVAGFFVDGDLDAVNIDFSGIATGNGSGLTNVNATTLDSLDSTSFLRSDAADTFTGKLTAMADIDFTGNQTDRGIYWGQAGQLGYIRQAGGAEGQLEIGSDDNIYFFETDDDISIFRMSLNNKQFFPSVDNTGILGTPGNRWAEARAVNFYGGGANLTNVNAQTLDSLDSTSFLRSDATDTFTGTLLTVQGRLQSSTASATTGSTMIESRYGSDESLNVLGSVYSSGATFLGFSVKPNSGAGGYLSTQDAFATQRQAYAQLSSQHIWMSETASTTTAPDVAVTMENIMILQGDGQLQLPKTGGGAGIILGGDTQLYRSAADILRTPDSLIVDTSLGVGTSSPSAPFEATVAGNATAARFSAGGAPSIELKTGSSAVGQGYLTWLETDDEIAGRVGVYMHNTALNYMTFDVGGGERMRLNQAGQLDLLTVGSSGGLLIGGDTQLYRSAANELRTPDNFVIEGNLTVQGSTTTVDSTNTTLADNVIVLNDGETGAGVSLGTAGLEIDRGTSTNVSFLWDEAGDYWSVDNAAGTPLRILTVADEGTLDAGTLDGLDSTQFLRSDVSDTMNGSLTVGGTANSSDPLRLKGGAADHVYLAWFADAAAQNTRSAWAGFGSGGTNTFTITNEQGGGNVSLTSAGVFFGNDEIWHQGNDGAGSGLDADLLDSYQADDFFRNVGGMKQQERYDVSVGTNATVKWTLKDPANDNDVTTATTNEAWRVTLTTTGTGTNTGAVFLLDNVDALGWRVHQVTRRGSGSNYPYIFIDTDGLPKVTTDHPSNYTVRIWVETINGGNNGTEMSIFGADSILRSNPNNTLQYRTPGGTYSEIWTASTDGSGSGLDADLLDGLEGGQFLRSDADDTASGLITLTNDGGLRIRPVTNGAGAQIAFSDSSNSSYGQEGYIQYFHTDTTWSAYGSYNDGFLFSGNQANTVFVFDGDVVVEDNRRIKFQGGGATITDHAISQGVVLDGLLEVTNEIRLSDGNAGDPSLTFLSDGSSGMYLGGGTVNFSYAGVARWEYGTTYLYPTTDLGLSLGSASQRWNEVRAASFYGDGANLTNIDAETLDGIDSTGFLETKYLINRPLTDANLADTTGVSAHYLTGAAINDPPGVDHYTLTLAYTNAWAWQVAGDPRTEDLYLRTQNNTSWGSWYQMWHSGNDGAGSGLDADLLDGQQGTYYRDGQNIDGLNLWNPDGDGTVFRFNDANATYNGWLNRARISMYGDNVLDGALLRAGAFHAAGHLQASQGFYIGAPETNGTQVIDNSGNWVGGTVDADTLGGKAKDEFVHGVTIRVVGSGNDFPTARAIRDNGTNRANNNRGLGLAIYSSTGSFVSYVTYDTYGSAVDSDAMATALDAMTSGQIGVIASYDAFEQSITNNLRASFENLGLTQALEADTAGYRTPYAAIFQVGDIGNVYEDMKASDSFDAHAAIHAVIQDGTFTAMQRRGRVLENVGGGDGNLSMLLMGA